MASAEGLRGSAAEGFTLYVEPGADGAEGLRGKGSRRLGLLFTAIAAAMVLCVKLSGVEGSTALAPKPQVNVLALRQFSLLDDNATAADESSGGDEGQKSEGDGIKPYINPDPEYTVGFNNKHWTSSDWVDWIIPGPVLTMLAAGFMFYMYGAVWAISTFAIMFAIDVLAYYANL